MKAQSTIVQNRNILDELIENAIGLPVSSQDLLLMMAKAMRHTRNCLMEEDLSGPSHTPPVDRHI